MDKIKSGRASFWSELKRRKIIRVLIAYVVVGWALIQIADATVDPLHLPEWSSTLVVWLVGLGFPIALILAWIFDMTPEGIEVTPDAPDAAPDTQSIAVLPFVNMSDDSRNEYFSDGLSEELLNSLVRLQSLRVCSRTSSFALKGQSVDMPTIATRLGVRYVLEGSVRRSGDRVRITAQLIDAVEDRHLWSETYDRELQDIFAVQEEIAGHILGALRITLTPDEITAIQPTTSSVEALDRYLRGRDLYHRTDPGHLERAMESFHEAIRIDPDYALAWAGLTYVFVDIYWYQDHDSSWLDKAHEASTTAVQLAPHLAESHAARGLALRAAEHFDEAEAEFQKAIAINPRLFEPVHFYAQMMRSVGNFERAANLFLEAASIRPEDYQALAIACSMFESLGDLESFRHHHIEDGERLTRAIELNPNDGRAWVLGAGCWRRSGDDDKARAWVKKAQEVAPTSNGVMYNAACLYAQLGDTELALDMVEKAVELGSRNKRYFETDNDFDSIREHPRFVALMETI
jgi:adenylate cyclase